MCPFVGVTTLSFVVDGVGAVSSFVMRGLTMKPMANMLYRKEVTLIPLGESRPFNDPNAIISFVMRSTKTLECGVSRSPRHSAWNLRMFGAFREIPKVMERPIPDNGSV